MHYIEFSIIFILIFIILVIVAYRLIKKKHQHKKIKVDEELYIANNQRTGKGTPQDPKLIRISDEKSQQQGQDTRFFINNPIGIWTRLIFSERREQIEEMEKNFDKDQGFWVNLVRSMQQGRKKGKNSGHGK